MYAVKLCSNNGRKTDIAFVNYRVTAGASSPKGKRVGFVELVLHSDIFF